MPDEIKTAANFLGIAESEFIKEYCEEHFENNSMAISPARKHPNGECIFLKNNNKCAIHPVKPYECRKVYGCEPQHRHQRIRDIILKRWTK